MNCFKYLAGLAVFSALAAPWLPAQAAAGEYENVPVVFKLDFNDPELEKIVKRSSFASIEEIDGRKVLKLETPAGAPKGDYRLIFPLPLEAVGGRTLLFSANVKAEDVLKPGASYNGLKFQLHFKYISGADFWKNPPDIHGTFDWKKLSFGAAIPGDADKPSLMIGFEDSKGKAWISDVEVRMIKDRKDLSERKKAVYDWRVDKMPVLRGFMSPFKLNPEDISDMEKWNVNCLRWQMAWTDKKKSPDDMKAYDEWISGKLGELDKVLALCREKGIKVVIDLHSSPGGNAGIFSKPECQRRFIEIWQQIASRYKENPAVWGYDIMNEPILYDLPPEGVMDWPALAEKTVKAIRKIDADVPIIIETEEMASVGLFGALDAIPEKNIIYSLHFYSPGGFTHQLGKKDEYNAYPGKFHGTEWNKEKLRETLKPVLDFQKATGARIYVGEFSAIRWAPGADKYVSDCIDIFEENGWDWTFHAFREWDGWSPEHNSDYNDHKRYDMTDRKSVLLKGFSHNQPVYE